MFFIVPTTSMPTEAKSSSLSRWVVAAANGSCKKLGKRHQCVINLCGMKTEMHVRVEDSSDRRWEVETGSGKKHIEEIYEISVLRIKLSTKYVKSAGCQHTHRESSSRGGRGEWMLSAIMWWVRVHKMIGVCVCICMCVRPWKCLLNLFSVWYLPA